MHIAICTMVVTSGPIRLFNWRWFILHIHLILYMRSVYDYLYMKSVYVMP